MIQDLKIDSIRPDGGTQPRDRGAEPRQVRPLAMSAWPRYNSLLWSTCPGSGWGFFYGRAVLGWLRS